MKYISNQHWLIALLLIAVTLIVYGPVIFYEFLNIDDTVLIVNNPQMHSISLRHIIQICTSLYLTLYIPLTMLSYLVEFQLGNQSPIVFHLVSILLHALNGILVYIFLQQMLQGAADVMLRSPTSPSSRRPSILSGLLRMTKWDVSKYDNPQFVHASIAAFCALLFVLHPINVEAVTWISARKDLLMTCFVLLTLITFQQFLETKQEAWIRYSLGAFLLALLSKGAAVITPLLLIVLTYRFHTTIPKHIEKHFRGYLILAAIFLCIGYIGRSGNTAQISLISTGMLFSRTIFMQLQQYFFPVYLFFTYPYLSELSVLNRDLMLATGALALLACAVWKVRHINRDILLGSLMLLIGLLPSAATFVHMESGVTWNILLGADRYMYLSQIGLLLIIGSLLWQLAEKNNGLIPIFVECGMLVLFALTLLTRIQMQHWRTTHTLYERELRYRPEHYEAHYMLGITAYDENHLTDAQHHLTKVVELRPNHALAHQWLGFTYAKQGKDAAAMESLRRAVEIDPSIIAKEYIPAIGN